MYWEEYTMELAYLYIEEYRNLKKVGLNFSNDVHIDYDAETKVLKVEKKDNPLPDKFWGENISNLSMIVGNNGVGKTSIMQYIISVWEAMMDRQEKNPGGIILMQDASKLYCCVLGESNYEIIIKNETEYCLQQGEIEELKERVRNVKMIYLTNTWSFVDYQRCQKGYLDRSMPLYDCAEGSLMNMNPIYEINSENKEKYENVTEFQTYYVREKYKQVKFVFDKKQYEVLKELKKSKLWVPVPEKLYIDIFLDNQFDILLDSSKDSWNKHYDWDKKFFRVKSDCIKKIVEEGVVAENKIDILRYQFCRCCIYAMLRCIMRRFFSNDVPIERLLWELLRMKIDYDMDGQNEFINLIVAIWNVTEDVTTYWQNISLKKEIVEFRSWYEKYCREFIEFIYGIDFDKFVCSKEALVKLTNNTGKVRMMICTENAEWFTEFLKKYRYTAEPDYYLDFDWGLSSGETNLLSIFARLYWVFQTDNTREDEFTYLILNKWEDKNRNRSSLCENIVILADEVDLTFHPEWQRVYIDVLTSFLQKLYPSRYFKNIQLVLSTHSPIMLSDIPQQNVLFLGKDKNKNVVVNGMETLPNTFGQNIHLLYRESFFLEKGTMGQFAHNKIEECFKNLSEIEGKLQKFLEREKSKELKIKLEEIKQELEELMKLVSIIAEPIIKKRLERKIAEIEQKIERRVGGEYGTEQRKVADFSDEQIEKWLKLLKEEKEKRGYDKNSNV